MVYRPILNIYKLYFISQPITWMIINTLTENSKKTSLYAQTKPNETKSWFMDLLRYLAMKRTGSIEQLPVPSLVA